MQQYKFDGESGCRKPAKERIVRQDSDLRTSGRCDLCVKGLAADKLLPVRAACACDTFSRDRWRLLSRL